jgi:tetratricopeptide (TPR) repeat protein
VGNLISASLIVRDEEKYLAGCLRSISGLVDEIVVVDTGSGDRSREIAAAHGARLVEYKWQDDFAAARNHAIEHAAGDWILYIDADERVRPGDREAVEAALARPGLCACTVRFYPRTGFTAYPEYRLFRRDPRIRFRSAIHETILPDLQAIVAAGEGRIGSAPLTIDHLGYDGDQSHKSVRNLPLLQKQVREDPERIYLWWHLGCVYHDRGELAEAEAAWWEGVGIARRRSGRGPDITLCFIELAKLQVLSGDERLALVREAKALQPGNLLLHWIEARLLVAAGRYAEAMPIFERLGAIEPEGLLAEVAYDRRILGAGALAEAGNCAFLSGRYRDSEEWYRRAESRAPDCIEFRVKRQLAASRGARSCRNGGNNG